MSVKSKFDCHSGGVATALAEVLSAQGWLVRVLGSAVLTDLPTNYAGCFCGVLVRIAAPSKEDLKVNLGSTP